MAGMKQEDFQVGIVGGGPCGMMTALLLARQGVKCVVFERKPGISTHPKAMGVSRRTAEIYRQLGLLGEIEKGSLSREGRWLANWAKSLVGEELGRVPITELHSPLTPCTALHCPQTWVEKVLFEALKAEQRAEIRFESEVGKVEDLGEKVRLTLKSGATMEVPWLVAADGAGSAVRQQLGIETAGPGDMGHFINTMFRANYEPHLRDRPMVLYNVLSEEFFEGFVSVNGKDVFLMHHFLEPGETVEQFPKERLVKMIKRASGLPDEPVEVLSISPWVMSPKVAKEFRKRRVLLTGDASARVSPAGGLGLNTGLQSAHNLAWKLALVAQGKAGDELLNTYTEERQGVGMRIMQSSNKNAEEMYNIIVKGRSGEWEAVRDMIGKSRRAGSGLGQDLGVAYEVGALVPDGTQAPEVKDPLNDYVPTARPGARAPHVWIELGDRKKVSTLDWFGTGFCLVVGSTKTGWPEAADEAGVRSISVPEEAKQFFEVYEIEAGGAVLVRPDGYVGARWKSFVEEPKGELQRALGSILSCPGD